MPMQIGMQGATFAAPCNGSAPHMTWLRPEENRNVTTPPLVNVAVEHFPRCAISRRVIWIALWSTAVALRRKMLRGAANAPVCMLQRDCANASALPQLWGLRRDGTLAHPDVAVDWRKTHADFGMPRGVRYLPPDGALNNELGRDHAWLPVTHTHTLQGAVQVGLWFHYTRGCSDFVWNVGRTMLARNKCHAAGLLEQRARANLSWDAALDIVARKLVASMNISRMLHVTRLSHLATREPFTTRNVSRALASCAAGHGVASESRELAGVILSNALDYVSAATLQSSLVNTSGELDSLQFHNRCEPPLTTNISGCDGNVEVWDVRFLQQPVPPASALKGRPDWIGDAAGIFGRLAHGAHPQPCNLSASWHYCIACEHSVSEESCCLTSVGHSSRCASGSATSACPRYGPEMERHLLKRLDPTNPLTLETLWSVGSNWWDAL